MSQPPSPTPSRRDRRRQLEAILDCRDLDALKLWGQTARSPLSALSSALFSNVPLRCWRAIEAIGHVAALIAQADLEAVRNLVRHNFWMMNDESGNIGWYAPETIGETLYRVPVLIDEYAGRLPAFFVEEPFERGTYWAVARLAAIRPDLFTAEIPELVIAATHADPVIRYRALNALARIDPTTAIQTAELLKEDFAPVTEYDPSTGLLITTTPAALAAKILS